jgi:sterol 3beta-glucosyltransferase
VLRIGDVINDFRTDTLGLKPLGPRNGPSFVDRVKIPWTYCMSPALVPKPADWANHIGMQDIS